MRTPDFATDDELYLGNSVLDEDHRVLCQCLEDLLGAQETGADAARLDRLLQHLVDCTHDHCRREEELMSTTGYDKTGAHLKEHQRLMGDIAIIRDHVRDSGAYDLGDEVGGFLRGWLSEHIKTADRDLADYLATLVDGGST